MPNGNGNGGFGGPSSAGLNDALQRMIAAVAMQHGGNVPPGVFAGNPPGTPGIGPQMGAALGGAPWDVPPGVLGALPGAPGAGPPSGSGDFPVTQYGAFPPARPDPSAGPYPVTPIPSQFPTPGAQLIPGQFQPFTAADLPRMSPGGTLLPPGMAPGLAGGGGMAGGFPGQGLGTGTPQDPYRSPYEPAPPQGQYWAPPGPPPSPSFTPDYSRGGAGATRPQLPIPQPLPGGGVQMPPGAQMPFQQQWPGGLQLAPGQSVPGMQPGDDVRMGRAMADPSSARPPWFTPSAPGQPSPSRPSTARPHGALPFEETAPGQLQLAPGQFGPGSGQPLPGPRVQLPRSGQRGPSPDQLGPGSGQPLPGRPSGLPGSQWGAEGGVPYQYQHRGRDYRLQGYPGGAPTGGRIPLNALEKAYRQQQMLLAQGIRPSGVIYGQSPIAAAAGGQAPGVEGGQQPGQPAAPLQAPVMQIPKMPTIQDAIALAGKLSQPFYGTKQYKETQWATDQFGNKYPFEVTKERNVAKEVDPAQLYQQMLQGWQAQADAVIKQQQAQQQTGTTQQERADKLRQQSEVERHNRAIELSNQLKLDESQKTREFKQQQAAAEKQLKKNDPARWEHETKARKNDMTTQMMLAGNRPENLPHPQTEAEARALGPGAIWVGLDGLIHANEGRWMGSPASITPGGIGAPLDEDESETQ